MPLFKGLGLRRPSKSTLESQRLWSCRGTLYKSTVRQRPGLSFSICSLPGAARKKKTGSEKNWNYQRGAKDCMRFSDSIKLMIFGFILAIGITLIQPYLDFGAGQSFGRSGSSGASRMQGQRPFSDRFNRFGFFGVGELGDQGDQQVIIIQQFQSPAATEPREPITNRIYVQPRWVDGGYGVQVLEPGYWSDPKQAAVR